MFRLIQTSDTRGDCTASYDVQLDKVYTVKEFLEAVLTNKADEWGAFYLMVRSKRLFWQNPSCEYKHGQRTGTTWANILMRYGDRKIAQVKSDGGWTRMDYYIWLDVPEEKQKVSPKPTEKEEKMKNELPTTDCLLVVQAPYALKTDRIKEIHERLVEQKKTGVIFLAGGFKVLVVPKDIEVRFDAENEENENSEDKEGPET